MIVTVEMAVQQIAAQHLGISMLTSLDTLVLDDIPTVAGNRYDRMLTMLEQVFQIEFGEECWDWYTLADIAATIEEKTACS